MQSFHSKSTEKLFEAILLLDSPEECEKFFEDICTIKEIQDMAQRFETALLLDEGMNYQTISQKAGTSTATISRVNKCLHYGAGGYRYVIDKLKEEKK